MVDGVTISKSDLKQLFQYNRFLGDQYNDGLGLQDAIAPHSTVDRMVAAHFEVSEADLEKAKGRAPEHPGCGWSAVGDQREHPLRLPLRG
jgi:hypothetical protein